MPDTASAAISVGDARAARSLLWLMGAYGFVAGLPLPLSGFTFRLWLSEGGVSLAAIGLTANIGLAYSLKFLWAPMLDQPPPGPLAGFGRRRGWLLAIQPCLACACVLLAISQPAAAPLAAISAAALVAFLSATQDIAIDAWRIETFPPRQQGMAMAAYVWGYRTALLLSGAGAIKAADIVGWHGALLGVAAMVGVGPLITLMAPEPLSGAAVRLVQGFLQRLSASVVAPLREFLTRPGAPTILAFVALFKLGEAMAGVMTAPFYHDLGFDRASIAVANGPYSLGATFVGTALGGWLVARLGVGRALLGTGIIQTLAMAMYVLLAYSAGERHVLFLTVVAEAFAEGMADAAFITYLSGLCSVAYTATQYALLSSLAAVALRTVGGLSGFLAQAVGWKAFYSITMFAAVPAMVIMLRILRRYPPAERPVR
ncbi:MAG: MFS transporter [Acetobacteraceae bacterium]|nr:MFS transporter [Acetobacteraceae bacterium]MBV8523875.1 MFS transporter [Acetobacteraceae bacterium]MBV8589879.1 MFS transporter [Acetobacteraceae bacterium]